MTIVSNYFPCKIFLNPNLCRETDFKIVQVQWNAQMHAYKIKISPYEPILSKINIGDFIRNIKYSRLLCK